MLCQDKYCPDCYNIRHAAWQKRMAIRIPVDQFDLRKLVNLMLRDHWMHECTFEPYRVREGIGANSKLIDVPNEWVVCYTYDNGETTYLRWSHGPLQGYFWDMYGDAFHSKEVALVAISMAPAPTRVHAVIPTHGH